MREINGCNENESVFIRTKLIRTYYWQPWEVSSVNFGDVQGL